MSKKKKNRGNTFLQSRNKKNMLRHQNSDKGKKIGTVHHSWDGRKRNVYNPTKEGLEMFLKEVGGKSPFYYEKGTEETNRHLLKMKKHNGYLWTMWREVMGLDNRTGVHNRLKSIEPFYWFAELEHLITNDEMFWTLINDVWCNKSEVFTDNPSILERYGRSKVSLERRMECAEHLQIVFGKSGNAEHHSSKGFMLNSVKDDEITLYRSFKVEKGKSVRKGVKKNNNPDYYIQEEGRGWSYSMNKTNSIFLNGLLGTFYYKNYLNMNDDDAMKHLQKQRHLSVHQMKNITYNDNFYNCIGTYTVKRKDIMYMTDDWGEMEVVVNPKDVKLIYYRFLNIFDYMTQKVVMCLVEMKNNNGTKLGRSGVMNIDCFYAKCRRLVEKVVIDKPQSIIQSLTNKGTEWCKEVIYSFYQGDMCIGYLAYEDDTDSSCRKYLIAHMDKERKNIDYKFA